MQEKKILNHPDREEIIKRLLDLESVQSISKWLQAKHPENKDNQIAFATLAIFRKEYLNMDSESIRLLRKERQKQKMGLTFNPNTAAFTEKSNESQELHALRVKDTLLNSPTYRERLKTITDARLDAPRLVKELHTLLSARLESYYNEISLSPTVSDSLKTDKMFAEYVRLVFDLLKDSKKITDDHSTAVDEGTVNLNIVHEQIGMVRDIVKELLAEIDPGLALEFMDRLKARLDNAQYVSKKTPNIIDQVNKLNNKIKKMQESVADVSGVMSDHESNNT